MDDGALARVICTATCKGGVAKTSLTANIAGLAAMADNRTLVVDLDPQGDLSDDLGYFDHPRLDDGAHLAECMLTGDPLDAVITGVRPNLDVIPGGDQLVDVAAAARQSASDRFSGADLLARALEPVAREYDLVLIDTPPTEETLQLLAMRASRWLLVPTKADTSSIRAIQRIAARVVDARAGGHQLDILGAVLVGVPTAATRVRADAERDIRSLLGDVAPLFEGGIRDSSAVARQTRAAGILAHELAEKVEGAEPFWQALRAHRKPTGQARSAPALADDYVRIAEQVLRRIAEIEAAEEGAA